jgi:hypothetical protein
MAALGCDLVPVTDAARYTPQLSATQRSQARSQWDAAIRQAKG